MKIFTVVGARPQFIKAAVVSRAFKEHRPKVREILIHTGQHYDANMSDVFFRELNIPHPTHNLGVGGGTHGQNTGRMLEKLEQLMLLERPDEVLVYGDTDSTLAAALAASKLQIPLIHVEAGLRSFNRCMPEEVNRVLTDHVATLLCAPTKLARTNLHNEGIADDRIHIIGDVMYDAALFYKERALKPVWFDSLGMGNKKFILATVHRAENTDDWGRMQGIFQGLEGSGLPVVLPLHPRTRDKLQRSGFVSPPNVHMVDPVGYLEMVWLEERCGLVATDSGGLQKEAYFNRKPCVTFRSETEWKELVDVGANVVVGTDPSLIAAALQTAEFKSVGHELLYGDGRAGEKIVSLIAETFK